MANPEHLEILKQGVEVWNNWRSEHANERGVDLSNADLKSTDLSGAVFSFCDLNGARLNNALLKNAVFNMASLKGADLSFANLEAAGGFAAILKRATLRGARLDAVKFKGADFTEAALEGASFAEAELSQAILYRTKFADVDLINSKLFSTRFWQTDLRRVKLHGAFLYGANLNGSDLTEAMLGFTSLSGCTLGGAKGLETVTHESPSSIGVDTIYKSQGKIPDVFLRGCGLSDLQIEQAKLYQPELSNEEINNILYRIHDLRAHQAIQLSPLFISYSHTDATFVDIMEAHLNEKGVRFWRDVHHSTAGRLERQIDRAIRLNPTVLLILSEHSVQSDWVQHEARLARKLEIETKRDVLCPVALDDSWKDCKWPERLREQIMEYNILDFSKWRDEDEFQRTFSRLLDGLDLFYK
jgi:uncharacterized protein YjbI with pentapeptide repeats